jgi:hypothetical protein
MRQHLRMLIGFVIVFVATAQAGIIFSGSGTSGTLSPGGPWIINFADTDSWSIPGVANGTVPWNGSVAAWDFHISFSGLPQGVVISTDYGTDCTGGVSGGTVMCSEPWDTPWTPTLDGPSAISFVAPGPMYPDDSFFVNIMFTGPVSSVDFTGEWSTAVPEPATLGLLGASLFGLAIAGFRRRFTNR